ncbi:MAG: ChrR family anti-sigma-E factor [Pseudomonadota bacterium]
MKTNQHPTDALLAQYAAGDIGEAVSLAIAAHLTYCPECRAKVAEYEAMFGGVMAAEPMAAEAPSAGLMAMLDGESATPITAPQRTVAQGPLPRAIAEKVGVDFDAIPWKFRLPGVMEYEFIDNDGEKASLLKVRPGASVPQHTHEADELTVVFDGLLEDGDARYGIGDFSVADQTVDHHPQAGGDRTCICLAVLTGGLTFTGRFGRALNLFS